MANIPENNFLVLYKTTQCPACEVLKETLKKLDIKVPIYIINLEHNPQDGTILSVMSVPTLIFFNNNRPITETVGAVSGSEIIRCLDEAMI